MVGTEVEASGRGWIPRKHSARALNGFGREVVQRGITNAYDAEVSGAPPSPVAEIVEIDIRDGRGERIERVVNVTYATLFSSSGVPGRRPPYASEESSRICRSR